MKPLLTDIVIIGGGIVGSSTALQLKINHPRLKILLLEKEKSCAQHQTGHNSGVVHAGVYYPPGSLKAEFCKKGAVLTEQFCEKNNLPYHQCGKLLVATNEQELERMEKLRSRCKDNEIDAEPVSAKELQRREPGIIGKGALFVKKTAITDYVHITRKMLTLFKDLGGEVVYSEEVMAVDEQPQYIDIRTTRSLFCTARIIVCGGLIADRLAKMMRIDTSFQIVPFRGEYYCLPAALQQLVHHLIYPIPDPELPFLGVHLTPMIDGALTVGPNAVLGWKREGYGQFNVDFRDIYEMLGFPGFWKVIGSHLQSGVAETIDSFYKRGYLRRVQKYCPQISIDDLLPYPAGVRAQAVMNDGSLVHDFLFVESPRSLHVCNAPSPAATSALPIGRYLSAKAAEKFAL